MVSIRCVKKRDSQIFGHRGGPFDCGFVQLCQHIEQTYALDRTGHPIRLGQGWYRATGTYSAFNTCNTWVASAFRKAGCPITPGWCSDRGPLLLQARQLGKCNAGAATSIDLLATSWRLRTPESSEYQGWTRQIHGDTGSQHPTDH